MSEEQRPEMFEEAFQHLEHDAETERSFILRHGEILAGEEEAADERYRQEVQDATHLRLKKSRSSKPGTRLSIMSLASHHT
jgi:hypothetical protein